MKTGRNEPCPCGSGKKYKRCCGLHQAQPTAPNTAGNNPTNPQTQMQLPPLGLAGQHQHLATILKFKPPDDPRNIVPPQGAPGNYTVTFVLQRPGHNLLPERQYSYATGLHGDSHLAIAKPAFSPPGNPDAAAILVYAQTEDGNFVFRGSPNDRGFLGKIESEPFHATSFLEAEEKAYRALAPSLSNWSAQFDIPLHIYQVDSVHVASGNTRMSMVTPYWEVTFETPPTAELKPEFRGYASLYREALGSNSPIYAYLCLFKIIEAITWRRQRLAEEAKQAGQPFRRPQRRVPATPRERVPWLNAIFPARRKWDQMALDSIFRRDAVGKKFGHVIEKVLEPLRNDIAHALSGESGELTLSIDDVLHTQKVNSWLPLTKCIARRMLKDEFPTEFLAYLKEDGTIIPSS